MSRSGRTTFKKVSLRGFSMRVDGKGNSLKFSNTAQISTDWKLGKKLPYGEKVICGITKGSTV